MLKIKDNIDLKELEKYGCLSFSVTRNYKDCWIIFLDNDFELKICKKDRTLKIRFASNYSIRYEETKADILYDLIQAGLVEKVGEYDWFRNGKSNRRKH